jgi:Leucine-rich repeat (LRR) protein
MAAEETAKVVQQCTLAKESSKLDLSGCKLTAVPQAVFFLMKEVHLLEADFSNNEVKKLSPKVGTSQAFHTISLLRLDHNKLSVLPESLSELKELTEMSCSNNSLTTLPMCIRSMEKLRVLNLSSNQISEVDVQVLRHLPSLEEVNLEGNPIDPSCKEVLSSVVDLKIKL